MMQTDLTGRQNAILEFIRESVRENGYPPSYRDICSAVKLKSTSSVHKHLSDLEKLGYIRRDPSKPRAIELVDSSPKREVREVPVIGSAAAGQPLLSADNTEEFFPLPADRLPDTEVFMLRMKGESMIQAGILDGDLVLAARQDTAESGDIVSVLTGDSVTVRTFYRERDYIRLQPENNTMEPVIVHDEVQILGKVIGVFRFL